MNTPPGLVGAALLFWGWETGLLGLSVVLALVLEASRLTRWRWASDAAAFNRLWDLTVLGCLGAGMVLYSTEVLARAVTGFLQWLPVLMALFMAAQAFSAKTRVDRNTFLWLFRRKVPDLGEPQPVNVSYPYAALCVLAASAANARDARFYAGVCALAGYALWRERPRRVSGGLTAGLFAGVVILGYVGHQGLNRLQTAIELKTAGWLYGFIPRDYEEQDSVSALGGLGTLKLSRRVVMEIEPELPSKPPKLLRQTSFNRYAYGNWYGIRRDFFPVREEGLNTWALLPGQTAPFSLSIACYLPGGRSLLTLPLGAKRITDLPAGEMFLNRLGTVRVTRGPEFARYRVLYKAGTSIDAPPDPADLEIPASDADTLERMAAGLKLDPQAPEPSLRALAEFFQVHFKYQAHGQAGFPGPADAAETPLHQFLVRYRAGHCEYFATAAALLLREAKIPTRYATGFVLAESARQGPRYIVRERHAHAWTLVYYKGAWHDFDATPPDDREDRPLTFLQSVADRWSTARFHFNLWRWTYQPGDYLGYLVGSVVVLAGGLGWRFFRKQSWRRAPGADKTDLTARRWPGQDSEFFLVEAHLRKHGLERQPSETAGQWVRRVQSNTALGIVEAESLAQILGCHYRYRFDPQGLDARERQALAAQARRWLQKQEEARSASRRRPPA
jgi:hypothetical protein